MKFPQRGEILLCKIVKIQAFNAFCEFEKYPNVSGFLHVSQVSDRWIKDINKKIKVGEEKVVKIVKSAPKRIEVSIKKVSPIDKAKKLKDRQDDKKAFQILKAVSNKISERLENIKYEILKTYGSLRLFVEALKEEREEVFKEINIPKKWHEVLLDYTKVKKKELILNKVINAYSFEGNGVNILKKELPNESFEIKYVSAPKYSIKIKGFDYKEMEKIFSNYFEKVKKSKIILEVVK